MFEVLLVGQIDDPTFQRAITAAEWAKNQSHIKMELVQLYQIEWKSWIEQNRQKYNAWNDEMNYLVVINGDSDEEYQMFWSFCDEKFCYEEGEIDYEKQAKTARLNKMKTSENDFCYLSFSSDDKIVIELYKKQAPKTCDNFKNLCTSKVEGRTYKNTLVHRIVPNGWIQMGDIVSGSKGDNGHSSFENKHFADETFAITHSCRGMVGMANSGPHSNQSQFYITLEAKPYLDKKYVCFGKVIEGADVLNLIESVETFNERPVKSVEITDSGLIDL